jgi:hypothetical protein
MGELRRLAAVLGRRLLQPATVARGSMAAATDEFIAP